MRRLRRSITTGQWHRQAGLILGALAVLCALAGAAPADPGTGPAPRPSSADNLRQGAAASGEIAFVRNGDIWVMNGNGNNQRRLTRTAKAEWSPSWSPDAKRIVFLRGTAPDRGKLFMMRSDGTNQRALAVKMPQAATFPATYLSSVAWSPNGKSLAVGSTARNQPLCRLVVVPVATLKGRKVVELVHGYLFALNWRPDGSQVAVSQFASGSLGSFLFIKKASNGTDVALPDLWQPDPPSPEWTADMKTLVWSPNGTRVAYCGHSDKHTSPDLEERHVLALMALNGSWHQLVATSSSNDYRLSAPTWSQGGSAVAYATSGAAGATVRVFDTETGITTIVATNASSPAWSPR